MTTQVEQRPFRTINLRLDLWQRLALFKAHNPKLSTLNKVIEHVLDKNIELRKEIKRLRGGHNEGDKLQD